MTAEQLRPDDLPMSDDAKRAMALELISDEIAYSPPFGGALHVWRWVKEQIVAASTAPTATNPENSTGTWGPCGFCGGTYLTGHRETCVLIVAASPTAAPDTAQLREADTEQFEQAVDELEQSRLDVYRVGFLAATNPATQRGDFEKAIATHAAARQTLLSLFRETEKDRDWWRNRCAEESEKATRWAKRNVDLEAALTPRPAALEQLRNQLRAAHERSQATGNKSYGECGYREGLCAAISELDRLAAALSAPAAGAPTRAAGETVDQEQLQADAADLLKRGATGEECWHFVRRVAEGGQ